MNCPNCGKEVDDQDNFCLYCGEPLHEPSPPPQQTQTPSLNYDFPQQTPSPTSKTNGFAIAGFICSFFIPILGLIFSLIGNSKANETNSGRGLATAGIIISILFMIIRLS